MKNATRLTMRPTSIATLGCAPYQKRPRSQEHRQECLCASRSTPTYLTAIIATISWQDAKPAERERLARISQPPACKLQLLLLDAQEHAGAARHLELAPPGCQDNYADGLCSSGMREG